MKYLIKSIQLKINAVQTENTINLFQQFFIHANAERYEEIKFCLKENVLNPLITNIYLLNERLYTDEELGINDKKIIQIVLGHRLMYSDVFNITKQLTCSGYNILANSDIFFDNSLLSILKSDMNEKPTMMAQLRWDYDGTPTGIKIFGPRFDSQDAWIWHSKYSEMLAYNKAYNFQLGQAGCDNHITYLFKLCGFELVNDPELVHCLHYHKTQIRDYTAKNAIQPPYVFIIPIGVKDLEEIKIDVTFEDNDILFDYIRKAERFIIPRIAGVENQVAYMIKHDKSYTDRLETMKKNAGVSITTKQSASKYSKEYYNAFKNSELYAGWSSVIGMDNVYNGIKESHDYIEYNLCKHKKKIWAESALEIYNYIKYKNPWTTALKGKRILIISSFIESIREKIDIRHKIYGRELFPECSFVFIKPPSLAGDQPSEDWEIEYNKFCLELDLMRDNYDVALVSCGGIGNAVCNYIYETGHSAIYVGGVLSMMFGVYGKRWLHEKSSILRMYMNEHWSRPKVSERPLGWEKIENGGCYW